MKNLHRLFFGLAIAFIGLTPYMLGQIRPALGAATTAWQNGAFNVDVANIVAQSNIVLGSPNPGVLDSIPMGNGNLGVGAWAANGFTVQLNRVDAFPTRKSPGWVVVPGLSTLTSGSGYAGILDLYNGMFRQSGGGMGATTYVLHNKDELIIDVTGANPNSTQTAQIQLWSGRSPAASANGAFAALAESWVDSGAGGSGRTFGTLAGITAGGRNVTASVVNSTTVQVSFNPNTDGTFRIVVASPTWTGGDGLSTITTLIGGDATASTSSLQATHLAWWHNFWASTGLIKITGTNGPYVENIRDIELYAMAISSSGQYPGNHAGTLDMVSTNKDGVTWAAADYWHWNLRMHVGANLMAGHPELNTPYFNLYASNVANIQAWTQQHMHGDGTGICVPETMRFNGNGYQNNDIGNPSCMDSVGPLWNAMDLSTGAEVSLWVWQQYLYTQDINFLRTNYPVMADSARFYLSFSTVGSDGKRHTYPSNAHETQWNVHDPTTDIAAMTALFPTVIKAAQLLNTDSALVSQLQAAIPQILDYARTDTATRTQLLTASSDASGNDMIGMSYDPTAQIRNGENIGLEPVYPYNLVGLGSPANLLALANRTYQSRPNVGGNDWTFDALDAARLGRASDFQANVISDLQSHQNFSAGFAQFSSTDFTPYVEMDGVIAAAVEEALVQNYDGVLRIAPAWPMSSWDVDGTVYIQGNSKVHVQVNGGQLVTVVLEAGQTGNIPTVNPWGSQNVMVVDSNTGSTIVGATTANQFTIPVTAGHAYIIELVASPTTALPYAPVTANPATTSKTLGAVNLGLSGSGVPATVTPNGSIPEAPYGGTAWPIPGQVEVENYDVGGEGVAYHDADAANQGGQYRSEGVDIETTSDTGGGYDVGWTASGEWMKYTVNVTVSGTYTLNFRVASPNTGSALHLEVDGNNVTGSLTVPNTGGWQTYTTFSKTGISLSAGQHVLRLVTDAGGMNYNWFSVTVSSGATSTPTFVPPTSTATPTSTQASGDGNPYGGTPWALPGKVEAENYNTGGQNVAYNFNVQGNLGTPYRTDCAQNIEITSDTNGGYDVGWTGSGEWMKYTVNVTSSGTYSFDFRVASPNTGSAFHLEVDGNNVTGSLPVPNTGGWQVWTDVIKTGISLSAGQHVLRLFTDVGGMNYNWFSATASNTVTATSTPTFVPPTSTATATSTTNTISTTAWYLVINQGNGKCVDDTAGGTTNGTAVQQWDCGSGNFNQGWQFRPTSNGYYNIISRNGTNMAWDVTGISLADGALIQLWSYGGGNNQQWMPVALDSSHYKFVSRNSGKCLDVPNGSMTNGTQLDQSTCNGATAQSWSLSQQP
jgi:hypothetical protein